MDNDNCENIYIQLTMMHLTVKVTNQYIFVNLTVKCIVLLQNFAYSSAFQSLQS